MNHKLLDKTSHRLSKLSHRLGDGIANVNLDLICVAICIISHQWLIHCLIMMWQNKLGWLLIIKMSPIILHWPFETVHVMSMALAWAAGLNHWHHHNLIMIMIRLAQLLCHWPITNTIITRSMWVIIKRWTMINQTIFKYPSYTPTLLGDFINIMTVSCVCR